MPFEQFIVLRQFTKNAAGGSPVSFNVGCELPCGHFSIRECKPYRCKFILAEGGNNLWRRLVFKGLAPPDCSCHDIVLKGQLHFYLVWLRIDWIVEKRILHLSINALHSLI